MGFPDDLQNPSKYLFCSDGGYDIYQQQQQQHHDMEMDRRLSLQQQMSTNSLHHVHSSPNITSPSSNNSQPPAAPPAPPAPPPAPPAPPTSASAAPPAPPAPAPPPAAPTGGPPPPPPPPMPPSGGGNEPVSGLAAALQAAKLRKTPKTENSGGSTTSSAGSSGYGSIGKGKEERPPMASMMDEMQKTLARRRAKVERGEDVSGILVCFTATVILLLRNHQKGPPSLGLSFEKCCRIGVASFQLD